MRYIPYNVDAIDRRVAAAAASLRGPWIPASILKPKCDACGGAFEPSELISHYHCGLGTRHYCRHCN